MTFLNNTNTTVLPDFQFLTSPSNESQHQQQQQLTPPLPLPTTTKPIPTTTTNHIPIYPIPKTIDCNQYGNNITNNNHSNTNHVNRFLYRKKQE